MGPTATAAASVTITYINNPIEILVGDFNWPLFSKMKLVPIL